MNSQSVESIHNLLCYQAEMKAKREQEEQEQQDDESQPDDE